MIASNCGVKQTASASERIVVADESVTETPVRFEARDGFRLHGTLLRGSTPAPAKAVVFNAGGGIAVQRYSHFLRHLARAGASVLAYDYRGVGNSRLQELRGFQAGIEDWAEFDHPAAVDFLATQCPSAQITSVSHSIGCMVAAALPSPTMLEQMVFIAPHTGYWGDYRRDVRIPMAIMWHVVMPALAGLLGYFPGSALKLGDNMPARVALQWGARTGPYYRFGAYGGNPRREYLLTARMASLSARALVIAAADDCFATDAGIRRFLMNLPSLRLVRRECRGSRPIGHWGLFRRRNAQHWSIVSDFVMGRDVTTHIAPEWLDDDLE